MGRATGRKSDRVDLRCQTVYTALTPKPKLTFRSDFLGLLIGFLFMMPCAKLLVEGVEVGLPEPNQLLIIFHSIPPAGPSTAQLR